MPTPYSPFNQPVFNIKPWNTPTGTTTTPTVKKDSVTTPKTTGSSGSSTSTETKPKGIAYNPAWAAYGVSSDIWSQLNATQQTQVAIAMNVNLANYAANSSSLSVADATAAALKDPEIVAKYADAFNIDSTQLAQGVADLNSALAIDSQTKEMQFEQDRKNLAEAHASAGTAYSGFRGKAQENLAKTESGIVTSTRLATQQKLRDAQQAFEAKWGTSKTPTASVSYNNPLNPSSIPENISGTTVGGISGTQKFAQQADVNALAAKNVELAKPVPVTAVTI